jgi:hypothetical protein
MNETEALITAQECTLLMVDFQAGLGLVLNRPRGRLYSTIDCPRKNRGHVFCPGSCFYIGVKGIHQGDVET